MVAEFAEGAAQRHGRARAVVLVSAQPAYALPFLAEVHEVEEQAEGVRHFRGLAEGRPLGFLLDRLEQLGCGILADALRKMAQVFNRREHARPALLLDNRAQARGEEPDFAAQCFVHTRGAGILPASFGNSQITAGIAGKMPALPGYTVTASACSRARRSASKSGSTRKRWLDSWTSERWRITYSVSFN